MPHQKSSDYKETAVQYYLIEDKTQEEVCKIFKCSRRSLMRWVEKYKKDGKITGYERTPKAYKVHKEHVEFLLGEIKKNKTITINKNNISEIPNWSKNTRRLIEIYRNKENKGYAMTGVR